MTDTPSTPHAILWDLLVGLVKRRCYTVQLAFLRTRARLHESQFEAGLRVLKRARRITIADRQVQVCVEQPAHLAIASDAPIPKVHSTPERPRMGLRRGWSLESKGKRRCKLCQFEGDLGIEFESTPWRFDKFDYLCRSCRAARPFRKTLKRSLVCESLPIT